MMLYKAQKHPRSGKVICMDLSPHPSYYADMAQFERACLETESFNAGCTLIVKNEQEHDRAKSQGWRNHPADALAYFESLEQDIAKAAAEANFRANGMSAKAQAELQAAHGETSLHVTDVVGVPRRGRKPKSTHIAPEPAQAIPTPTEADRE